MLSCLSCLLRYIFGPDEEIGDTAAIYGKETFLFQLPVKFSLKSIQFRHQPETIEKHAHWTCSSFKKLENIKVN